MGSRDDPWPGAFCLVKTKSERLSGHEAKPLLLVTGSLSCRLFLVAILCLTFLRLKKDSSFQKNHKKGRFACFKNQWSKNRGVKIWSKVRCSSSTSQADWDSCHSPTLPCTPGWIQTCSFARLLTFHEIVLYFVGMQNYQCCLHPTVIHLSVIGKKEVSMPNNK